LTRLPSPLSSACSADPPTYPPTAFPSRVLSPPNAFDGQQGPGQPQGHEQGPQGPSPPPGVHGRGGAPPGGIRTIAGKPADPRGKGAGGAGGGGGGGRGGGGKGGREGAQRGERKGGWAAEATEGALYEHSTGHYEDGAPVGDSSAPTAGPDE